jgi:hypothetical protein
MDEEEEIIKLDLEELTVPRERKVRLGELKKNHLEQLSDSARKNKAPELRILNEEPEEIIEEIEPATEEKQRHFFEGRSVDYTIDEILHTNTIDPDSMEKQWGSESWKIPPGWVMLFSLLVLSALGYAVYLLSNMSEYEDQKIEAGKAQVDEYAIETARAETLVKTIDTTVRQYLAAETLAEKLRYVRHADVIKTRMETYYASHPLTPAKCRVVTDYSPLTVGTKTFWRVVAPVGTDQGEAILVEQLSDTEVKVDWESHVHYQPMEWDRYAAEKPTAAMEFRVDPEPAFHYQGEFADELRWACYQLSEKSSSRSLFGFVLRGSAAHVLIEQCLAKKGKTMILRLQFAKAIKLQDCVVIDKVISPIVFRIDPPSSPTD